MSLPRSVQAQADAAAQHFAKPAENPDADKAKAQSDEQNPQAKAPDVEQTPDGDAQAAKQAANTPKDDKQEPKAETQDALYWQHRFNVLQGKYNSELPALRQEIDTLKQKLADAEKQDNGSAQPQMAGVTDEEMQRYRTEYGDELVSLMVRLAGSNKQGADPELSQRLERLEAEKQEDTQARFWMNLEQAVPNYRDINGEAGFREFLAAFDPQTGKQRQQMLVDAQQALDAKGVADVFKLYLSQSKAKPKAVPDDQIEPKRTRATDTPQGKRQWTRADVSQFYRDKTAGKYSNDEAERLEADIFAAQTEGRIR